MTILETRTLNWRDEGDCAATAARIAARPGIRRALITLHGTLGAGKTTFTRHLLRALGVAGPIKSPTYSMLEEYPLGVALTQPAAPSMAWHFDFYRFSDPHEWEDAGFRDIFAAEGLKLAEWPEKAGDLLPPADLGVHLHPGPADSANEFRSVVFEARSALGIELLP